MLQQLYRRLEDLPRPILVALTAVLFALVAASDFLTSPRVATSIYYIAPLALASWFIGKRTGALVAVAATASWLAKDVLLRGYTAAELWILFWNGFARFATFLLIAYLFAEVRVHLQREQQLAQRDTLTGALNRRAFRDRLDDAMAQRRRTHTPLSLLYVDLDNFKPVNDRFGHAEGDRVLAEIGQIVRGSLRRTDQFGRVGGDEFVVLLTNADQQGASEVVAKLLGQLNDGMRTRGWPVGFSGGLVTLPSGTESSTDALLSAADSAMYRSKAAGKGTVTHEVLVGPAA